MVLNKLIGRLKANEALTAFIGSRIEPYYIEGFEDGIIYSLTPLSDNGIVRTDRLEIHIVAAQMATLHAIDNIVRNILLTIGDEPLEDDVLQVALNGGGTMEDLATNTKHLITYYTIVSK